MHTAFLLPLLLLAATAESLTLKPGCQPSCGTVDIPYPFGIGQGCFRAGFEIQCNNGKPTLGNTSDNTQVTSLSVTPRPEARVMLRVAYQCYNSTGAAIDTYSGSVDLNPTGVYRISDTANELFVLGCNTMIFTNYTGCVAYTDNANSAQDGACAGIGCCHINIPPGLTDNLMRFTNDDMWPHSNQEFCPCDYGFIVEKGNYTFRAQDLHMDGSITSMPLRLDWAIRDGNSLSCAEAPIMQGYTCVSANSKCVDSTNGPGYFCNCTEGYEGNPYLDNGCTSIGLGVFLLVVAVLLAIARIEHDKRKLAVQFEKNGGNILKEITEVTIFTEKELTKITKNNSEPLGKGNFGNVYKGTLTDKTVVAVKSYIKVDDARRKEFAQEMKVQLKMTHANVLKLRGCCLQLDVPMLVYEFAGKGSLREILHVKDQSLPVDLRLDIAIGSAKGLSYMHSKHIRHGDVKPDNILLADNFVPKISDFGLSKVLIVTEYFTQNIIGAISYIDPVFRNTGLLTPKSDVYSFGAVLLELISRKPIGYGKTGSLIIEFRHIYETEKSGKSMFDLGIVAEKDILILEAIGKLAIRCLKEHQDDRPDMTEVADQLINLKVKFGRYLTGEYACYSSGVSGTSDATLSMQSSTLEVSGLLCSQPMNQAGS
ncbi:wall-associated receptor kinase 2-like [Lolium rigidum]|uniref:wall-associated receptor kinase 2-like n=1 Tax=Lolium rigidum TaxID=89674 RepID=UPI001F5D43CC|nr:wall-associated receptor kinase 2-like [Lolium rigidum]